MDALKDDDEEEDVEDIETKCSCDEDDIEADEDDDAVDGDENEAEAEGSSEDVNDDGVLKPFSREVPFLFMSGLLPQTLVVKFPPFDGLSSQIELALAPNVLDLS